MREIFESSGDRPEEIKSQQEIEVEIRVAELLAKKEKGGLTKMEELSLQSDQDFLADMQAMRDQLKGIKRPSETEMRQSAQDVEQAGQSLAKTLKRPFFKKK